MKRTKFKKLVKKATAERQAAESKITPQERADSEKRSQEEARWKQAEESWTITPRDLEHRVRNLRHQLEYYAATIAAIPFEICNSDMPYCLDRTDREDIENLVDALHPRLPGLFNMIDDYAKAHGCQEQLDFNSRLFLLKSFAAEHGYKIGVLAGAIMSGASKETVDRLESGLTYGISLLPWLTKTE